MARQYINRTGKPLWFKATDDWLNKHPLVMALLYAVPFAAGQAFAWKHLDAVIVITSLGFGLCIVYVARRTER